MRIVIFARVPNWYSFRQDRLAKRLEVAGHEIRGIVVEKTATLASLGEWAHKLGLRVMVEKVLKRLFSRGSTGQVGTDGLLRAVNHPTCNAPVYRVASHNSTECLKIIRMLQPEVLVLRGCLPVNKSVLDVPAVGAINPHYALLPAYRGMEVTEWSVLHGDPCAVSVHWVTEAVDAGGVIASRLLDLKRGESLGDLREQCATLSVELLVEVLRKIELEGIRPEVASSGMGRQYFAMHPRLYQLAEQRLKSA